MNRIRGFLEQVGATLEARSEPEKIWCFPPRELHLELTYRCNSRCIMCNLRYLRPEEPEMTADEISGLVDGSRFLKDLRYIVLSGGEALLRKDFFDVFRFFSDRYPRAGLLVLSNFMDPRLLRENAARMVAHAGDKGFSLGTSLDGVGDAHDRVRGQKGSFDALQSSLDVMHAEFPGVYFSMNFTITPENTDQILPTYRWCSERGYHISYQALVQKRETRDFSWSETLIDDVDGQIDEMIADMCARRGAARHPECSLLADEGLLSLLLSLHYIPRYLRERRRYFPNCPCGEKFAMLDPAGNLYFCPVHKNLIAGNVRRSGFDKVWMSKEADRARAFFNEKKCHCWLTCTNGHMLERAFGTGRDAVRCGYFARDRREE